MPSTPASWYYKLVYTGSITVMMTYIELFVSCYANVGIRLCLIFTELSTSKLIICHMIVFGTIDLGYCVSIFFAYLLRQRLVMMCVTLLSNSSIKSRGSTVDNHQKRATLITQLLLEHLKKGILFLHYLTTLEVDLTRRSNCLTYSVLYIDKTVGIIVL